ncbi:triose-phosphate isomerase [Hydrotalea sp.]|uniref:triose-phosphate isomerase n=1 Tax=Hydrotalea sp. TaxID=2881279 RepID=UPI0026156962|nr:triose-phosphate isomerase [Hydrotalea sp.]
MRKQIAAANWKMNLNLEEATGLLKNILQAPLQLLPGREVIFAVPFPFIPMAAEKSVGKNNIFIAAQNCSNKKSGAYTGETAAFMLQSVGVQYIIIGHSERREYFHETNAMLAGKIDQCFLHQLQPLFCCGEPLSVREEGKEMDYVARQLAESLFHLTPEQMQQVVIAYEPIWAIGTGKTATTAQAQEMHAFIRQQLEKKYGHHIAQSVSILYGGSVKAANAKELFSQPDVDGGLVGGASLQAAEFITIIQSLD